MHYKKIAYTWNGSAYVAQTTNRFVYDGWNLVAELNHTNGQVRSYLWGLDLSGSMQGAGGVGGLLSLNAGTNGVQFVAFDGNGNISALLSATNGAVGAAYEYGPFGEVIVATGPAAKANPLRFSTKYQDDETLALYYGYRSYNPSAGRWLNRDLIAEVGGRNLYNFVANSPIGKQDVLGLASMGHLRLAECGCKCKTVKVSPAGGVALISHFPTIDVGVPVPVKIEVEGHPSLCKCKHVEKGTFQYGYPNPTSVPQNREVPIDCKDYTDLPGLVPVQPFPPGVPWSGQQDVFHFVYNMTITVSCEGYDGSKSTDSAPVVGDYWFTVTYGSNGATAASTPPK